ncbi:MAG: biosynthetic-type acetolactate synthase large subunit [Thermoanaerobacteraceae bacterium]|nr:biosynthetic-type acetolactate synthase large subunit [Thermoanaerobacteraceae bacterium]
MGITAAQALVKGLEEENVTKVFGYPGGAVLPIYDALIDSDIQHVLVRHEQGAVHMANGYARISGQPGVCIATSGPGATNLVTGIATAYMDSVPVVIITGQVATSMVGTDAFQEVDITGITLPITKHNYLVKRAKDIPRIIKEAFYIARTGRPGPVLIDIPKDVAASTIEYQPVEKVELRGYKPNYKGHPQQIERAVRLINKSKKPVIYVGGGVINSGATEELYELAWKAQMPVTTTLMGLGSFPEDDRLSLHMLGLHGAPYANYAVTNADLLIGLGVRFDDRVTGAIEKFAPQAKIIHIDIDPAEIGKNVVVDVPIVGDLKLVLRDLIEKLEPQEHLEWLEQIEQWKQEHPLQYGNGDRLRPQYVIEKLGELTNHRAVVTADVGQHQMWAAQFYKFTRPRSFLTSGGLGTMGYGFPAAIGAQIADPDALVVTVTGDGSFQMAMQEMGTAVEQNLPIKVLLFNNNSLALVRQLQHFYCDKRYTAVSFTGNPDFAKFAECYGAVGLKIETRDQVEPVLKEALNNGRLTIIEVSISEEELVLPMVPNARGLDEMVQFPFGEEDQCE